VTGKASDSAPAESAAVVALTAAAAAAAAAVALADSGGLHHEDSASASLTRSGPGADSEVLHGGSQDSTGGRAGDSAAEVAATDELLRYTLEDALDFTQSNYLAAAYEDSVCGFDIQTEE
jgi:hypothetical protein